MWITIFVLGDKEFHSLLQGRFNREATGSFRDIYDGEAYAMEMTSGGFLSFPMNVSLTMNTDGVQVFHSSNYSLWPVFFSHQ